MRSEGIGNKIILIALLCAALVLFLYMRPRLFSPDPPPTLMDRLPESEFLGRFQLLDLARETSAMMYYHKIPFRDLASAEFLLSQAKSFGLDVQKPGYFFSDDEGEWGVFMSLIDSSRVQGGLKRLNEYTNMRDTVILKQKISFLPDQRMYLFYDQSYIFLYHGNHMQRRLGKVLFAQKGDIGEQWERFESLKMFTSDKLVVYAWGKRMSDLGLDYGLFAHDSDSISFKLKSYIKSSYPLKVRLKEPSLALEELPGMEKSLNLHLDITEFRKDKNHPLYKWVKKQGQKVSFPVDTFFDAWNGDLSFRQGGTQMIPQEVVETGYDEEFNLTEIRSVKMVPIPGFSILFTTNEKSQSLISQLFAKGIITKDEGKRYRFLFSPPLKMTIQPDHIVAYSSEHRPKLSLSSQCSGIWNYNGTDIVFRIDTLRSHEIYGSVEFPVSRLIRKSKFF
jgi:hypothetical protein